MSDLTKKLRDTERALKLERETVQRISRQRDQMAAEVERLQVKLGKLNAAATAVIDSRAAVGLDGDRYSVDMGLLCRLARLRLEIKAIEADK